MAATSAGDRDFATTIVRNFLYSSLMVLVWDQLQTSQYIVKQLLFLSAH
jgi:ring-1,2-phenylacetyl-CoA epoxidase subunit PaaC